MKIKYATNFIQNIVLVYPRACVYQFNFLMKTTVRTQKYTMLYYAWTGIMHKVKYFCVTYVLCVVIQS